MEFTDVDKNLNNGQNMGGLGQHVYYAAWEDVLTFPTAPVAAADLEANGTLTGELIMKPGKKMNYIYITDDTGDFEIEPVGEADCRSFVQHLRFFTPGLTAKVLGFMNWAKNSNVVFIVLDNDNQQYLMGDAKRAATYVGAPDGNGTGKETAARRGVSMEFVFKTANSYLYPGAIPLAEAVSA